jgi:hypothetical protein
VEAALLEEHGALASSPTRGRPHVGAGFEQLRRWRGSLADPPPADRPVRGWKQDDTSLAAALGAPLLMDLLRPA